MTISINSYWAMALARKLDRFGSLSLLHAFFRAGQLVAAMLDSVALAPPGGVGVGKDVSRLAWCDPPF